MQGKKFLKFGGYTEHFGRQQRVQTPLDPQPGRPLSRADCHPKSGKPNAFRPCPWVGCRYHLLLEVLPSGAIRMPYGDEVSDERPTCSLDVAEEGTKEFPQLVQLLGFANPQSFEQLVRVLMPRLADGVFDKHWIHTPEPSPSLENESLSEPPERKPKKKKRKKKK